jgi:uncharacterized membrane protein
VSLYEWLLFLHVLAAFSLVTALVLFWALIGAAWNTPAARAELLGATLGRPAGILVAAGSLLTLVFGVWLAIYLDGYELWDGWILASLVLWVIGVGTGERSGRVLGQPGGFTEPALRRRGLILNVVSSLAVLSILVLMVYKPGA